jgi:hypothetical protein
MTVRDEHALSDELADRWGARDLDTVTNSALRSLSSGTATDWGMNWSAVPPVPPISLGSGIPDSPAIPREA